MIVTLFSTSCRSPPALLVVLAPLQNHRGFKAASRSPSQRQASTGAFRQQACDRQSETGNTRVARPRGFEPINWSEDVRRLLGRDVGPTVEARRRTSPRSSTASSSATPAYLRALSSRLDAQRLSAWIWRTGFPGASRRQVPARARSANSPRAPDPGPLAPAPPSPPGRQGAGREAHRREPSPAAAAGAAAGVAAVSLGRG